MPGPGIVSPVTRLRRTRQWLGKWTPIERRTRLIEVSLPEGGHVDDTGSAIEVRSDEGEEVGAPLARPADRPGLAEREAPVAVPAADGSEAFEVLRGLARGKTGALSAETLARHVLRVTEGADFPVQHAAMEALLRRLRSARDRSMRVVEAPAGGSLLGLYRVRRADSTTEHRTLLRSVAPPAGSCDCADYARSALGLCKHLLAALERAVRRRPVRQLRPGAGPWLEWDPVRPLSGAGDWLVRVRWHDGAHGGLRSVAAAAARRWFAREGGALSDAHGGRPERRLELVRDLLPLARADGRRTGALSDPALIPLLIREVERLERLLAADWVDRELRPALKGLKRRLYPYQVRGRRALPAGRPAAAGRRHGPGQDRPGHRRLPRPALAPAGCRAGWSSCPPALKPQWLREWQHFTDAAGDHRRRRARRRGRTSTVRASAAS